MSNVKTVVFLNATPVRDFPAVASDIDKDFNAAPLYPKEPKPPINNWLNYETAVPTAAVLNIDQTLGNQKFTNLISSGRSPSDTLKASPPWELCFAVDLKFNINGRIVVFPNVYFSQDSKDTYIYQNWRNGVAVSLTGAANHAKAAEFLGIGLDDKRWSEAAEYSISLVEFDNRGICYMTVSKIGDLSSGLTNDLFAFISKEIERRNNGRGGVDVACRSIVSDAYKNLHPGHYLTLDSRHFAGAITAFAADIDNQSVQLVGGTGYISNGVIKNETTAPKTLKLPDYKMTYTDTVTTTLDHTESTRDYGTVKVALNIKIGTKDENIQFGGELNFTSEHLTEDRTVKTQTHTETRDYIVPGQSVMVGAGETYKTMVVWKKALVRVRYSAKFDVGQYVPAWGVYTNPTTGEAFSQWVTIDLAKVMDVMQGSIPTHALDVDYMGPAPRYIVSQSYTVESETGVNASYRIENITKAAPKSLQSGALLEHPVEFAEAAVIY